MKKQQLTAEQKRLDLDIWIIGLVTLGVFILYAVMGNEFMSFIKNDDISVISRLLLSASIEFGIAGLGITIVCIMRKEKLTQYGLIRKNAIKAIVWTILCLNAWGV